MNRAQLDVAKVDEEARISEIHNGITQNAAHESKLCTLLEELDKTSENYNTRAQELQTAIGHTHSDGQDLLLQFEQEKSELKEVCERLAGLDRQEQLTDSDLLDLSEVARPESSQEMSQNDALGDLLSVQNNQQPQVFLQDPISGDQGQDVSPTRHDNDQPYAVHLDPILSPVPRDTKSFNRQPEEQPENSGESREEFMSTQKHDREQVLSADQSQVRQSGDAPPHENEGATQVFDTKKQLSKPSWFSLANAFIVVIITVFALAILNLYMDFDGVKTSAEKAEAKTQKLSQRVEGYCKKPRDTKGNCPQGAWVKGRLDGVEGDLAIHNKILAYQEKRLSSVEYSRTRFFETLYGTCLEWQVSANPTENPINKNDPANCTRWEARGVAHKVENLRGEHNSLVGNFTKLNGTVKDHDKRIRKYHGVAKNNARVRKDQYISGCMSAEKTRPECSKAYEAMMSRAKTPPTSSTSKNPSAGAGSPRKQVATQSKVVEQREDGVLKVRSKPSE